MKSFDTKHSNTLESFDRKLESFESKDSEVKKPANVFVESFDTKDSESEHTDHEFVESFGEKFESFESKDTKVDGRSKPRTRKQINTYKRNFNSAKSIEWKVHELDMRVQHLQQLLLRMQI